MIKKCYIQPGTDIVDMIASNVLQAESNPFIYGGESIPDAEPV